MRILLFITSLLFVCLASVAQTDSISVAQDSVVYKKKYGIRVGADIAKLVRTAVDDEYSGFELNGDFRITKKFYLAAELGNETKDRIEENLNATTSGSYVKLGADYNPYDNWLNMNNSLYVGLRYGFSTFKQELNSYTIYQTNQTFPPALRENPQEFTGLTAHWLELVAGVKAEIFNNLFLGINVQLKRKITEDKPENFDNLFIPGFNRMYDFSHFGVGYGYTVSYLIPIFKK